MYKGVGRERAKFIFQEADPGPRFQSQKLLPREYEEVIHFQYFILFMNMLNYVS